MGVDFMSTSVVANIISPTPDPDRPYIMVLHSHYYKKESVTVSDYAHVDESISRIVYYSMFPFRVVEGKKTIYELEADCMYLEIYSRSSSVSSLKTLRVTFDYLHGSHVYGNPSNPSIDNAELTARNIDAETGWSSINISYNSEDVITAIPYGGRLLSENYSLQSSTNTPYKFEIESPVYAVYGHSSSSETETTGNVWGCPRYPYYDRYQLFRVKGTTPKPESIIVYDYDCGYSYTFINNPVYESFEDWLAECKRIDDSI